MWSLVWPCISGPLVTGAAGPPGVEQGALCCTVYCVWGQHWWPILWEIVSYWCSNTADTCLMAWSVVLPACAQSSPLMLCTRGWTALTLSSLQSWELSTEKSTGAQLCIVCLVLCRPRFGILREVSQIESGHETNLPFVLMALPFFCAGRPVSPTPLPTQAQSEICIRVCDKQLKVANSLLL